MKRPLLWGVIWFALGEVVVISENSVQKAGVLISALAFCVFMILKFKRCKWIKAKIVWVCTAFIMCAGGMMWAYVFEQVNGLETIYGNMCGIAIEGNRLENDGFMKLRDGINVVVCGRVCDVQKKEKTDKTKYNVTLLIDNGKSRYKVIIYGLDETYKMGQLLEAEGVLKSFEEPSNPGCFNMRKYYAANGVYFNLTKARINVKSDEYNAIKEILKSLRRACSKRIDVITDKATSALYQGMLLGDKSEIEEELRESFQIVGIGHILAISGLHISFLADIIRKLLMKLGINRNIANIGTMALLVSYGYMTGFGVATIRAVIMMAVAIVGDIISRDYDMLTGAAIALILMLISNPYRVWDGGLWLSMSAVCGVWIGRRFEKKYIKRSKKKRRKLRKLIYEGAVSNCMISLCINLITLPVILLQYYQFCPYSFAINVIILPLMSIVIITGILGIISTVICAPIFISIGKNVVLPGVMILKFYIKLSQGTMSIPGYIINTGKPAIMQVLIYYIAFFLICNIMLSENGLRLFKLRIKKRLAVVVVGVMGIVLIAVADNAILKERMIFMDVGQGDGIAINTSDNIHIMIDGGSTSVNKLGKYVLKPVLKSYRMARVDYWIITHGDTDHMSGLIEILEEAKLSGIKVNHIVLAEALKRQTSQLNNENELINRVVELADDNNIPIIWIDKGDIIGSDNFLLKCLHPVKDYNSINENDYSLIMYYNSKALSAVFTGDAGIDSFTDMDIPDYDILKVPHHGSKNSYCSELYEHCGGKCAVISCGYNNSYGHPHERVVEELEKRGIAIWRTDYEGALVITEDKFLE